MRRTDSEDDNRSYFRASERVFTLNGKWFFATREGECGPFATREQALSEASWLTRDMEHFQKTHESDSHVTEPHRADATANPLAPDSWTIEPIEESGQGLTFGNLALQVDP